MKYLFKILVCVICVSSAVSANDSPNWHLNGANEGWKDEFLYGSQLKTV